MKLDLTWGALSKACGGRLVLGNPEDRVDVVSTDSRSLKPGEAFWALKGASLDAHDFLASAQKASGWVVEAGRPLPEKRAAHVVAVPDTLKALHAFAAFHRARFDIPIAAVAGSNGKTTTKQMLRAICETQGPVCATEGNLNNQFGLPFSILELGPEHWFGVFELGESRAGDIEELARILQPTVGVLTNVGPAHLEFFGDLEGVFQCLAELPKAAPKARIALNLDDPHLARLAPALGGRAIGFGRSPAAAMRLIEDRDDGLVGLRTGERNLVHFSLPSPGRVQNMNAAAAAAGAVGLGIDLKSIGQGLSAFKPAPMRFEARAHASGATIILDAYNANPASMRAGIESFCESFAKEKRILALGDMKELGPESPRYHRELVEWAASLPVEAVFVAGPEMEAAARGSRAKAAAEPSAWVAELRGKLGPGVALYLKASRAMRFESIIEAL